MSVGQQLLQLGVVLPEQKTIIAAGMVFKKVTLSYSVHISVSRTVKSSVVGMANGSTKRLVLCVSELC